jgi:hypothetical protein
MVFGVCARPGWRCSFSSMQFSGSGTMAAMAVSVIFMRGAPVQRSRPPCRDNSHLVHEAVSVMLYLTFGPTQGVKT